MRRTGSRLETHRAGIWTLCAAPLLLPAAAPAESPAPAQLAELRGAARDALETSCGRCHDHTQPTARPRALRIFDLHDDEWAAGLTLEQMDHMVARFEGFRMPAADRATVQRFFDAERARRATLPSPAPSSEPRH